MQETAMMEQKINKHAKVCDMLHETYVKKNHDYGDSFGKSVQKRGLVAAMVRMEDKWNRLDNLTLHSESMQVKDEAIADTLLDLANYCIMTYMELDKDSNVPTPEHDYSYVMAKKAAAIIA